LKELLDKINNQEGPVFLEVKVKKGNRKDLGRPTTTPIQNKEALMQFLKK
jgi:phosphonopyruvate decarboxylase